MKDKSSTILSSEEVESLLNSFNENELSDGQTDIIEEGKAKYYDFKRPNTISREKKRLLYKLHENTAYQISRGMSNYLRSSVKVTLDSIDELSFEIFKSTCPEIILINSVKLKPLQGFGCITLESGLCMTVIDVAFGGSSKAQNEIRKPTDIEIEILGNIVSIILEKLKSAWEPFHAMNWRMAETSVESRYLNIASDSDVVLVVSFNVNLDYAFGEMKFCVPVASMENAINQLQHNSSSNDVKNSGDKDYSEMLKNVVNELRVDVVGILGKINITVNDLANLKKGDVIRLSSKISDDLKIAVERENKFYGKLGLLGSKKAMQITSFVENYSKK
ncbi:MAG: flagellar motor switch protein FliM [Candidatus Scalindua sp.]|nr:flagellar motor switch protein FliM [Candidatus Scalindua sp.]